MSVLRVMWLGRSPAWRAAVVGAVVVLAGLGWWLGSPLFIRTTTYEALPSAAPLTAGPTVAVTSTAGATTAPTAAGLVVLAEGQLGYVDSVHNGKGPVRTVQVGSQVFVRFDDVMITNAPDVHVYLSRETGGKWTDPTSLYLGALKATNGSFNYEVPAGTDVTPYKSVVVWCRAFAVLITWADLTPK